MPDLRAGHTVLVAAHGNSLRALVKHLDGISDDDIAGLNIPTGMPLVYELDDDARADGRRAVATSTPRPQRRPPRPSPTRVAEPTERPLGWRRRPWGSGRSPRRRRGWPPRRRGRRSARSSGRAARCRRPPRRRGSSSGDSSSVKLVRRSRSISSSSRPSAIAASTSRPRMIWVTRATMSSATCAIRAMVGRTSLGHREVGHPEPGDLGDVHREVAHPLQLADHPQRGDDGPQVAGDRLPGATAARTPSPRPARAPGRSRCRR